MIFNFILVLYILFSLVFGYAMQENFKTTLAPHLVQYMRLTLRELGTPPDPKKAAIMVEHVPMILWVTGPDNYFWSSPFNSY